MGDKARPVPMEGRHVGTPRERRAIRETTDAKVYTSEWACMGGCVCARMLSHSSRARLCATLWTRNSESGLLTSSLVGLVDSDVT